MSMSTINEVDRWELLVSLKLCPVLYWSNNSDSYYIVKI